MHGWEDYCDQWVWLYIPGTAFFGENISKWMFTLQTTVFLFSALIALASEQTSVFEFQNHTLGSDVLLLWG